MKTIVVSTFALALSAPIASQAAGAEAADCRKITENTARLACYDGFFQPATKTETKGNWQVSESKSKIDDSLSVILRVDAEKPYTGEHGRKYRPTLILRCLENTTVFYINADGDFLTDNRLNPDPVLRIDKQKAKTVDMGVSTDNKALGLWSGGRSIPWIKKMLGASTLLTQFTPVSDSPQTVTFNITGLEIAIKPLRKACGW